MDAFATHRNLHAEVDFPVSGSTAAMHYLGSRSTVANLGRRIVDTTRALSPGDFPAGDEVIVLTQDPVAPHTWRSGYASLAQSTRSADCSCRSQTARKSDRRM